MHDKVIEQCDQIGVSDRTKLSRAHKYHDCGFNLLLSHLTNGTPRAETGVRIFLHCSPDKSTYCKTNVVELFRLSFICKLRYEMFYCTLITFAVVLLLPVLSVILTWIECVPGVKFDLASSSSR